MSRPIVKPEIPLSTFALLFSEIVHYNQQQTTTGDDLEERLHSLGLGIGARYLELAAFRQGTKIKRDPNPVTCLQFVYSTIWRMLFGRTATGLVKGSDDDKELYLLENDPITNTFASTGGGSGDSNDEMGAVGDTGGSRSSGQVNCAAFLAGIINGAMQAMRIDCTVTASFNEDQTQTVFVVKVSQTSR